MLWIWSSQTPALPARAGKPVSRQSITSTPSEDRKVRLDEGRLAFGAWDQSGLVGADRDAGGVAQLAVVEAEGPGVPGADGATVLVDVAAGEVAAGVGAVVVDDVDRPVVQEDREVEAADLDVLALIFLQLVQLTQ